MTQHWLARAAGCILRPHPEMFQQIQFFLEASMKQAGEAGAFSLACLFVVSEYVGLLFIRACFPPNLVLSTKRTCFAGNWEMGDPPP